MYNVRLGFDAGRVESHGVCVFVFLIVCVSV